jgi:hypothetical protein
MVQLRYVKHHYNAAKDYWDIGIDQNNTASDLMQDFNDYIAKGHAPEFALDQLFHSWYGGDNDALLVMADYHRLYNIPVSEEMSECLNIAFLEELRSLGKWIKAGERFIVVKGVAESVMPLGFVPSDDVEKEMKAPV